MLVRIKHAGRIGLLAGLLCFSCNGSGDGGSGGSSGGGGASAGAASGGMSGGGTASGGAGAASGGAGNGNAGTSGGGSSGTASGGAGAASGGGSGTAGASGGSGGGGAGGTGGTVAGNGGAGGAGSKSKTTFFVTSDTSKTGKLGGLEGADKRCQDLAMKAGIGDHTFHAYLSTSTVNAKDRIGAGPWVNANGLTVAQNVAALHSADVKGDHTIFVDEKGMPIHGQWDGGPVEHDILTGSMPDGTVQAGKTCMDWTSDAADAAAQVGHSDGMGPGMATTGTYTSWNSSHENMSCADTAPRGGAGRLYCFAID